MADKNFLEDLKKGFDNLGNKVGELYEDLSAKTGAALSTIKADVFAKADHYVYVLDLPGVKKDDITLQIRENSLFVSAERNPGDRHTKGKFFVQEIRYGKLERTFILPADVIENSQRAKHQDGVLIVSFERLGRQSETANEASTNINID